MKFKRYSSYKPSEAEWIGEIPTSWSCLPGRRVFSEQRLPALESDPQLTASQKYGVIPQADFMALEDQKVMLALTGTGNFKHVYQNNFVISLRSFQGGLELSRYEGCVSPAYTVLASVKKIEPDYYRFLFKSQPYISALQAGSEGIRDGKTIRYDQFAEILLPIPSLTEQSEIASFLDRETAKIDTLIAKQEKLIELLKEKRQAVISHAVTKGLDPTVPMKPSGVEWLGDVPEHWKHNLKLLDMSDTDNWSFVNGPFGSDLLAEELTEDGVPVIYIRDVKATGYKRVSTQCVTAEKAESLQFCKTIPGDVLVAKVGDPPGAACVYPEGNETAIVTQDVIRIRSNPSVVLSSYLVYLINSAAGRTAIDLISVSSTRTRIGLGDFKQIRLPLPLIDEQGSIVAFLDGVTSRIDRLIAKAQQAIKLQQEHRTALISAAVTGKIDVREAGSELQEAA